MFDYQVLDPFIIFNQGSARRIGEYTCNSSPRLVYMILDDIKRINPDFIIYLGKSFSYLHNRGIFMMNLVQLYTFDILLSTTSIWFSFLILFFDFVRLYTSCYL